MKSHYSNGLAFMLIVFFYNFSFGQFLENPRFEIISNQPYTVFYVQTKNETNTEKACINFSPATVKLPNIAKKDGTIVLSKKSNESFLIQEKEPKNFENEMSNAEDRYCILESTKLTPPEMPTIDFQYFYDQKMSPPVNTKVENRYNELPEHVAFSLQQLNLQNYDGVILGSLLRVHVPMYGGLDGGMVVDEIQLNVSSNLAHSKLGIASDVLSFVGVAFAIIDPSQNPFAEVKGLKCHDAIEGQNKMRCRLDNRLNPFNFKAYCTVLKEVYQGPESACGGTFDYLSFNFKDDESKRIFKKSEFLGDGIDMNLLIEDFVSQFRQIYKISDIKIGRDFEIRPAGDFYL